MNVAQLIRRALLDANAVRQDGTTKALFTQAELLSWAQDGTDILDKALRNAYQDYGVLLRTSTDSSFRWDQEIFAMTGLQISSSSKSYTLPPDFLRLKSITPTTSGQESLKFTHLDMSEGQYIQLDTATNPQETTIHYDIHGARTLRIPNPPSTATDIRIAYVARSRKMRIYATGTLNLTQDSTGVVGTSSEWTIEDLYVPMEIIPNTTDTNTVVIVSQTSTDIFVNPSTVYPVVESFTDDTNLVLEGTWLPATDTSAPYLIASVPPIPVEHHFLITKYIEAQIYSKFDNYKAKEKALQDFQATLGQFRQDVGIRQIADHEFVDEFEVE